MGWLGDACPCRCGWVADQVSEEDDHRVCAKCGTTYDRKSWGWSVR